MSFLWTPDRAVQSNVVDGFEDGNLAEYSGDTSAFSIDSQTVDDGVNSLQLPTGATGFFMGSLSGLDNYPDVGDTHRFAFWFQSGTGDFSNLPGLQVAFGHDSETNLSDGYGVSVTRGDTSGNVSEELSVLKYDSGSTTELSTTSLSIPPEEFNEVEIIHESSGTISAELFDSNGSSQGAVSATDTQFITSGQYQNTGIAYNDFRAAEMYLDNWRIVG